MKTNKEINNHAVILVFKSDDFEFEETSSPINGKRIYMTWHNKPMYIYILHNALKHTELTNNQIEFPYMK